jgi:23S rRNA (uridine2552-2'-O)-methyltransferase
VAVDLLPMEPIEGVTFLQGDIREESVLLQLEQAVGDATGGSKLDLVVCDMAPNLSGIASADAARLVHLVELAVEFAVAQLKPGGALVAKAFHGGGYDELVRLFQSRFKGVKKIKPKASRAQSAETFLIGLGPKAQA